MLNRFIVGLVLCLSLAAWACPLWAASDVELAERAVVKIEVTYFTYSHESPWKPPVVRGSSGTGFIVQGNRILTNAHVVSQANTIRVQRPDQRRDYDAKILFIAHDCDLAILGVEAPEFFEKSASLEFGITPELNSPVLVIGFPVGGDRVSITRGIVSRKDMDQYSHSQVDYHMTIQVDAAINPGNSGGPALQNGKVIGIAFQVLTRGQNIGYLIPPDVAQKFLSDITDGRYDGYIDFGTLDLNTVNPVARAALKLEGSVPRPNTGVLIYSIVQGGSADGHLRVGDVLLSINGLPLSESGDVEIDGRLITYAEVVDNFSPGTPIKVEIFRDGKRQELTFPARTTRVMDFQRKNYDTPPWYVIVGGLVFQPLDANLYETYSQSWATAGRSEILYRFRYFLSHALYRDSEVDVILTRRLADPSNLYHSRFLNEIVQTVNGKSVRSFHEFVRLVDEARAGGSEVVVRFRNETVPLVLRTQDLRDSDKRVLSSYGVEKDRYLPEAAK